MVPSRYRTPAIGRNYNSYSNRVIRITPNQLRQARSLLRAARWSGRLGQYAFKIGKSAYNRWTNRKKEKKEPGSSGVQYVHTQSSGGKYVKTNKRKRVVGKKSLKKRVVALEKSKLPKSHYYYHFERPMVVNCVQNNSQYNAFHVCQNNVLETLMTNVEYPSTNVNLAGKNTKIKYNVYANIKVVNATIHKCKIRVGFFKTVEDTNKNILDVARDYAIDRGASIPNTVSGEAAASTTQSYIPQALRMQSDQRHFKIMSFIDQAPGSEFKQVGKIEFLTLSPGDETSFKKVTSGIYKPEQKDVSGTNHLKGVDEWCIIYTDGEISHSDQGARANVVGTTSQRLDIIVSYKYEIIVQNGLGLKKVTLDQDGDYTGFLTDIMVQAGIDNVVE